MPTSRLERDTSTERKDVFKAPYNPNIYVGELRDEDEGTEYVVLVSEFGFYLLRENGEPTVVCLSSLAHFSLHPPVPVALSMHAFV